MTTTQMTESEPRDHVATASQPFLTHVAEQLTSGAVHEAMQSLFLWLRCQKIAHPKGRWSALASDCLNHPIAPLLHQDPLTWRTFQKPKSYAGDATMLDLIYSMEDDSFLPSFANPMTEAIFRFTASAPASRAVCARRQIIARLIDQIAEQTAYPRILSIAAGHLREAALSQAVREGRIKELVAPDQDEESLATIKRAYGRYPVETVQGSVKSLLRPQVRAWPVRSGLCVGPVRLSLATSGAAADPHDVRSAASRRADAGHQLCAPHPRHRLHGIVHGLASYLFGPTRRCWTWPRRSQPRTSAT